MISQNTHGQGAATIIDTSPRHIRKRRVLTQALVAIPKDNCIFKRERRKVSRKSVSQLSDDECTVESVLDIVATGPVLIVVGVVVYFILITSSNPERGIVLVRTWESR